MRKLLILIIPAMLLLAGCSPEQQLVGKWKGKLAMGNFLNSSSAGPMANQFAGMISPTLELRPDKTFTLSMSMAPIDGTWKLDNNALTLTPKSVMGMSAKDAKDQAQKQLDKVQQKNSLPFPIPISADSLPVVSEMHATVNQKDQTITLDPGAGTFLAGFGKITFTKV